MEQTKSGFVALIGRPNVGKSTLMNRLVGQKIAITSYKPQTTRNRIQTVYTEDRGQIVFLDTPGIHKAKNKLGEYMVNVVNTSIREVDLILWLVEPTARMGEGEKNIAQKLGEAKVPVMLVINKVDTVPKTEILPVIEAYKSLYPFAEILPVSALKDIQIRELVDVLFSYLPHGPLYFDPETVTDQSVRQIAGELIREKALRLLQDEIPHGIAVEIQSMKERENGLTDIEASIICEKDSHKGIIIGKGGSMLKKIGTQARQDIEHLLGGKVNLKLWVKVRKEWRDNELFVKNYGYKES